MGDDLAAYGEHSELQRLVTWMEANKTPTEEQVANVTKSILEDKTVVQEEANAIFHLKREFPSIVDIKGFKELFVDGVTSYLLFTAGSRGELDVNEWVWLTSRIKKDLAFDALEEELLINIAVKAEKLPANFHSMISEFHELADDAPEKEHKKSFFDRLSGLVIGK